jgi:hypothetical protein
MTSPLALLVAIRLQGFAWDARDDVRALWDDEDGLEQSVEKMLYLGGAIVLAVAAIAFLYTQFGTAKSNVPAPNLPAGP